MSTIDDGGPAFPIPLAAVTNGNGDPWVWALTFRLIWKNIDAVRTERGAA